MSGPTCFLNSYNPTDIIIQENLWHVRCFTKFQQIIDVMASFIFCLAAFWLVLALVGVAMVAHAQVAASDGFEDEKGFHAHPAVQGTSCESPISPASLGEAYTYFSVTSDLLA